MNTNDIVNVKIGGIDKGKPKLKADGCILPFYKTKKALNDLDYYNKFIKSVESMIRRSKEYKSYKKYIMEDIGINYDQVMPNINADLDEKITIEMHHGPILTLYDYCSIVTDHLLENKMPVTSFRIYKLVLDEHFSNHVQIVMLSDLSHKLFHSGDLYINPKQAWGDIRPFLEKYSDGVSDRMATIINKNIDIASRFHSFDKNGILDVNTVERWDDKDEIDR